MIAETAWYEGSGSGLYVTISPYQRCPPGWTPLVWLDSRKASDVVEDLHAIIRPLPQPPKWAADLLTVALSAYAADRAAPRSGAADGWTRQMRLSVPVVDPDGLDTATLAAVLGLLTSDEWEIVLRPGRPIWNAGLLPPCDPLPDIVALFSGGLDALAASVELAAEAARGVHFVAHHDGPALRDRQRELFRHLGSAPNRLLQFAADLHPRAESSFGCTRAETTTRSRPLLVMAAAIVVASAYGARRVVVPQNGQLALNLPLTASRIGSCSVRAAHPAALHLVNRLLEAVGTEIRVENPLLAMTKGEVCERARRGGVSASAAARTVSCGGPPQADPAAARRNCGYCHACLVRRAGLLRSYGSDPTRYSRDPRAAAALLGPAPARRRPSLADLLALVHWLSEDLAPEDVLAHAPLPAAADVASCAAVVRRGREELTALLDAGFSEDVRQALEWSPRP
ncbi:MAG: 7-cyano-7-deazaguanine synthase [Carbonactinosporaceae bacterium]